MTRAVLAALLLTATRADAQGLAASADSLLTDLSRRGFSGVVLIAKDGRPILRKGYGLADRAANAPMTPASVVQIGSNTKDFTTLAILQYMERGRIALTDSLGKFFRDVPADKRGVTLDHLLRHRGGFAQHSGGDFDVMTREQLVAKALATPLLFPPGTDRSYSNVGFSLLAAIVEQLSGTSYDRYVQDNVLAPLGMRETGLLLPRFDKRRVVHAYRDGRDMGNFLDRTLAADGPYWNLRGNGGMLSTVDDMHRFYTALYGATPPVKPASRDLFWRPDGADVLAGSDLVSYFFYSRHPMLGLEIFLASNATDYPAPRAHQQLTAVLGAGPPPGARIVTSMGDDAPRAAPAAAVDLPDTPAGRAARKFMRANAPDADSAEVRRFLGEEVLQSPQDKRTLDERVAGFVRMARQQGAKTLVRVVRAEPHEITFVARSLDGMLTFTITVEPNAPHRITAIRALAE